MEYWLLKQISDTLDTMCPKYQNPCMVMILVKKKSWLSIVKVGICAYTSRSVRTTHGHCQERGEI